MPKTDSYSKTSLTGVLLANGTVPLTANWNMGAFSAESRQTATAAATVTNGFLLTNTTVASSGNQMYSPAIVWDGQGWKTTATAASQSVRFRSYVVPVQGAANPSANWTLESSINAAGFTNGLTFSSAGVLTTPSIFNNGAYTMGGSAFQTDGSINIRFGSTATTIINRINVDQQTAATSGVPQQYSGGILLNSTAWTGAASQTANFRWINQAINGTSPITAKLVLASQINAAGYNDRLTIFDNGRVLLSNVVNLKAYTVATLPAGNTGDTAYVTDALTPTFLVAAVGGGAVVAPVFYNGAAWVTY